MKMKNILCVYVFLIFFVVNNAYAEKIKIIASIMPLVKFTEEVGGDLVEVSSLLPIGANPHTYEPSPLQLKKTSEAKLYVEVGSGIEFELNWVPKLLKQYKGLKICNASKNIIMFRNAEGKHEMDPHVWASPLNAEIMVTNIKNSLVELDNLHKHIYEENAANYIKRLNALHIYLKTLFDSLRTKSFIVIHPSWGYFADAYSLKQIAVEHEGKSPGPGTIIEIINTAKKENIKTIFISPQRNKRNAEIIAKETGASIKTADIMSKDYIGNLKHMAEVLKENDIA